MDELPALLPPPGLGKKTMDKLGISTLEELDKVYDKLPIVTKAWLKSKDKQ
jgi:hypothetical protein